MPLIMENVSKTYGSLKALDNVNITFEDNSVVGLIGFNGSGKTTSFNILTNLIEKYEGNILIEEDGVKRKLSQKDRILFSYLSAGAEPQNPDKVISQFNYLGSLHGLSKKKVKEQIMPAVKILEFEDKLNKPIKSLSKGNQQKIKLIGAFINPNVKYLLLDEPFDGLDPIMVEKIRNFILDRKKDLTIIITSHRMEVVDQMCDSFYILKDGVMVDSKVSGEETSITISVNKEVPITFMKTIPKVKEVVQTEKENIIVADSIDDFKSINKKLISNPKYIWSSLKEKKLTESVFERYADE